MLLAGIMSETVQGIFFLVAVACFLIAAVGYELHPKLHLIALGLAAFTFVFMWNAFALS